MRHDTDRAIDVAVAALHDLPPKLYATCTGAGAGLLSLLWRTAGASRTLLGFEFPYDARVVQHAIGRAPASYCSEEAALALAVSSFFKGQRALVEQGDPTTPVIGLGLTAAVATDRTRRGADRVHIAVRTDTTAFGLSAQFDSRSLTRSDEGRLCDLLALNAILYAVGRAQVPFAATNVQSTTVMPDGRVTPSHLALSVDPSSLPVLLWPDGSARAASELDPERHVVFPGSFAPLHCGHDAIAGWVQSVTGKTVVFELAAANADKSPVPLSDLAARAVQFRGRWPVIITPGAALFVDKARQYGGCDFIVGVDTAIRILDRKYYRNEQDYAAALRTFRMLNTRFYVCDRLQGGEFCTVEQLDLPRSVRGLFVRVPCRVDVSSTELRAAGPHRLRWSWEGPAPSRPSG
jgi:hypothetical protein